MTNTTTNKTLCSHGFPFGRCRYSAKHNAIAFDYLGRPRALKPAVSCTACGQQVTPCDCELSGTPRGEHTEAR